MKRFIAGVLAFLLPVALVMGLFGFALYQSGEWRSEEEIADRILAGEPAFLGLAYRDNRRYYKHLVANGKQAEILVLGSSRSMQFSEKMFAGSSFYNAGGGANLMTEYHFFLESMEPEALPDTLILVLDQYLFQDQFSPEETWSGYDYSHSTFDPSDALTRAIKDWAGGKYSLLGALHPQPNTYGLAAVGRGSGYYPDGSYCYGNLMDHPEQGSDVGFHDSFDRITRGVSRFEWADTVYEPSLHELDRLLSFCKEHNIEVVGILPPYAPSVYQRMMDTGNYGYLTELPAAAGEILNAYGWELFDFTNMPDTTDAEYIDGYHGGDRVYARIAQHLAEESTALAGKIDTDYLDRALADSGNPLRLAA